VKFPIHSLKIDRSFIEKLNCDDKSTAIAKAIVSLGKSLGVNVIAEGVETKQQLDYLRSVGCPYAQGHLFSMSIDAETVQAILTRKQIQSP
jgi:EAL domain-containing protein (putative c-di-GMP-specific phosphodiesterase class I)